MSPNHRKAISVLYVASLVLAVFVAPQAYADPNIYQQHNLVSDGAVAADHVDPNLVNPWGIVFNPTAFVWVANNHTGTSTLYDGFGNPQSLVVIIPPPTGSSDTGNPTGIVYYGGNDFIVSSAGTSGPSRFIFASESGTIAGWAPNVDLKHAILVVDNSASHAIYKGLALAANGTGNFLYATDFHNARIDVFDTGFHPMTMPGAFADPAIPVGFAPFGIQNLNGDLYVTYAKQDANAEDNVSGPGLGFVDVFDANGHLIRRVATRGHLDAPWGLTVAPANFGRFSNRLLVGNFGDGAINAYDLASGAFVGRLRGPDHRPIHIDGLWGISFGNGLLQQPTDALFFAAGPSDETHGIYGSLTAVPSIGSDDDD